MPEIDKIKKVFPELAKNPDIVELCSAYDGIQELSFFLKTKAGEELILILDEKVDELLMRLRKICFTATRDELVAVISAYTSQYELLESFRSAIKNEKEIADVLLEKAKEESDNNKNIQDD